MHHNKMKMAKKVSPGFHVSIPALIKVVTPVKTEIVAMNRKERRAMKIHKGVNIGK